MSYKLTDEKDGYFYSILGASPYAGKTTTPLGANSSYIGPEMDLRGGNCLLAFRVYANQAGTMRVQERIADSATWRTRSDPDVNEAVAAGETRGMILNCTGTEYVRALYDNGGIAQTVFEYQWKTIPIHS